jgi:hypothetical protein
MPAKSVRMGGKSESSNRSVLHAKPRRSAAKTCSSGYAGAI